MIFKMFSIPKIPFFNIIVRLNVCLDLKKIYDNVKETLPAFCIKFSDKIRLCKFRDKYSTKDIKSAFNTSLNINRIEIKISSKKILDYYEKKYEKEIIYIIGEDMLKRLNEEEKINYIFSVKFTNPNIIQISGLKFCDKDIISIFVKKMFRKIFKHMKNIKSIKDIQKIVTISKNIEYKFKKRKLKNIKVLISYSCLAKTQIILLVGNINLMILHKLINKKSKKCVSSINKDKDYSKLFIFYTDKDKLTEEETEQFLRDQKKDPRNVKINVFNNKIHASGKSLERNRNAINYLTKFIEKHQKKIIIF